MTCRCGCFFKKASKNCYIDPHCTALALFCETSQKVQARKLQGTVSVPSLIWISSKLFSHVSYFQEATKLCRNLPKMLEARRAPPLKLLTSISE